VSDLERYLKDLNFNKLSLDEQLSLGGEINVNEASKVLQNMNNNKSSGSDGFSTEFINFSRTLFNLLAITPEPILYAVFSSDIGLQFLRKILVCYLLVNM
jgi:hypothetical protein